MLAFGLLLLSVQGSPEALANAARAALLDANTRVLIAEACAPRASGADLRARYHRLRAEASGLLPFVSETIGEILSPIRCSRVERRESGGQAAAALDRLADATARRRAAMRGLWIGPLHLCRDTLLGINEAVSEAGNKPILIGFSPALTEALRTETAARVGQRLPVILDGRTVMEPMVNEPIAGNTIALAGGVERGVDGLRAAADRPC